VRTGRNAGLMKFTVGLAPEGARRGVRVAGVNRGRVDT
jgi:NAD(P)-dependent dehydrogenase (short-subunit alcohol dehydrogenase family)